MSDGIYKIDRIGFLNPENLVNPVFLSP